MTGAKAIAGIMLLGLMSDAAAQVRQETFRDSMGRTVGRSVTDTHGNTTFFDASGRVTGRSTTSGKQTTIYGGDGRRVGTTTTKPR